MEEIWRDIKDYEGLYQVSNLGRVRSLNYRHIGKVNIRKTSKTRSGYLIVCLYKDGKRKYFSVHRLVAETFIQNLLNLPEVNHKDEDKTNNFVGTPENDYKDGNLEWCDYTYNNKYGTRIERYIKTNTNGKKSKQVLQYTLDGDFVQEWPSATEPKRKLGYSQGHISECCRGEVKSYKGYIWRYKEKGED